MPTQYVTTRVQVLRRKARLAWLPMTGGSGGDAERMG